MDLLLQSLLIAMPWFSIALGGPPPKGGGAAYIVIPDRVFHAIMQRLVVTGKALHYTELAVGMRVPVDEEKQLPYEAMDSGIPTWMHQGTDYLVSFP